MNVESDILSMVRRAARKKRLYLSHAVRQMARPDRMISTSEVRNVIEQGELIEDYPDDARGHSCLLLGRGDVDRAIHVVCSPKEDFLAVITAYLPDPEDWSADFRRRVKS